MKLFIYIFLFFFINSSYSNINYYYLYHIYQKSYSSHIKIQQENIAQERLFLFYTDPDYVCIDSTHIYIKKKILIN